MKKIKYMFFGIILIVLSSCSTLKMVNIAYNKAPLHKQYPNMVTVNYGVNKAYEFKSNNTDKLLINIEGSGWNSVLGYAENNKFQKGGWWYFLVEEFKNEFTVLVPEKFNHTPGENYLYDVATRKEYTLDNLVTCYAKIINQYLAENSYSTVIIVGSSEGACVLPLVYKNIKNKQNISGLVSISYGGLSGYEQIKILKNSALNTQLPQYILQSFDAYKKDIDLYPNSIGEIFGMTYRWFNSVFNYKPFDDYKNIDIPILFIHGELDGNVPVESTRYIQDNLPNKPFEYLYFSDADHHSFRNSGKTIKELISKSREWLNNR